MSHAQIMSRLHAERKPAKRKRDGAVTPVSPSGERTFPMPVQKGPEARDQAPDRTPAVTPYCPSDRYSDLGGISKVIDQLYETVEFPLNHPEAFRAIGVPPPSGIILYGPPGCGKTRLAHALAGECGVPFFSLPATEIVSGISGDSEAKLRATFRAAEAAAPSIIFIDQIDAIAGTKGGDAPREMSRRLVAQLGLCLDNIANGWQGAAPAAAVPSGANVAFDSSAGGVDDSAQNPPHSAPNSPPLGPLTSNDKGGAVAVSGPSASFSPSSRFAAGGGAVVCICATSSLESVDSSLRRPGRFEREVSVPIPSRDDRLEILSILTRPLKLGSDVSLSELARKTPGYVGADFVGVVKAAAGTAVRRLIASFANPPPIPPSCEAKGAAASKRSASEAGDSVKSPPRSSHPAGAAAASGAQFSSFSPAAPAVPIGGGSANVSRRPPRSEQQHVPLTSEQLAAVEVTMADFDDAVSKAQPCAMREGFSTVPSVTWEDVGALEGVREELVRTIEMPVRYPHLYAKMNVRAAAGVLLHGPPGCGKTLVAKAAANGCGANFISIKGPELLNKFVGESERAVRSLFARARASAPCVLFFDELDALAPRRGTDSSNSVSDRVVNQLLTELDGVDSRDGVFVVGATNRRDMIDDALLRPGRYDKVLTVYPPGPAERVRILQTLLRKVPHTEVDLVTTANDPVLRTASGADLSHVVKEAALAAIEREMLRASAFGGTQRSMLLSQSAVASAAADVNVDSVVVTQQDIATALAAFNRQRQARSVVRKPQASDDRAAVASSSSTAAEEAPVSQPPPSKRGPGQQPSETAGEQGATAQPPRSRRRS